jgi:hypothetical protein
MPLSRSSNERPELEGQRNRMSTFIREALVCAVAAAALAVVSPRTARAQTDAGMPPGHDMSMHMTEPDRPSWHVMQDGELDLLGNWQGGPRGGREITAPNWWMGMASHAMAGGALTIDAMFSLDALTEGRDGYRELFQAGEVLDGRPLVDRQHPHDFFMQLGAAWRRPLGRETSLVLAGGPSGEPALGPVAFMHRASAAELPLAPLSHHTFDSTHVSFGVATAAIDRPRWSAEVSAFNGREPDDARWDFDLGRMDSVSARVWIRPGAGWTLQASTGHLVEPEALDPGDLQRTTVSASWIRPHGAGFDAAKFAYGANHLPGVSRHAILGELTRERRGIAVSARFEAVQVETALFASSVDEGPAPVHGGSADWVQALTVAMSRGLARGHGVELAIGAAATIYGVPSALRPVHGRHPASAQIWLSLRRAGGATGRMWNMRMTDPPHAARGQILN